VEAVAGPDAWKARLASPYAHSQAALDATRRLWHNLYPDEPFDLDMAAATNGGNGKIEFVLKFAFPCIQALFDVLGISFTQKNFVRRLVCHKMCTVLSTGNIAQDASAAEAPADAAGDSHIGYNIVLAAQRQGIFYYDVRHTILLSHGPP